ncbi:Cytochrome P450 monooxygenase PikC [Frankia canadensis]|uniref:Cytochrome P450 monooxygenase PikC n=1 Tax=Frankia canadensis TaxID=1836972 RepID=A0A2I2L0Q5_9ACTN|nr:cytochrome P450 [Frankia canadensis]SNQ51494.1 Cytochrome P450 monooxygenase PikC [Frankia canadensis]SOU58784.1 Cytochrome P450 monooxygenase PikC [Frankia canadensis]
MSTTASAPHAAGDAGSPVLAAFAAARENDPYPAYRAIRAEDPLPGTDLGGHRITLVTRHGDAGTVLSDPAFGHGYKDRISPFRPDGDADDGLESLLRTDPPDHTRLRRLVSRAFTPAALAGLAPDLTVYVNDLLDAALAAGDVDAVAALARPVPLRMICRLLGVPAVDEQIFCDWAETLIRGVDPDFLQTPEEIAARRRAARELDDYFRELIARLRARPGDDLVSRLVSVHLEQDALTGTEVLALCAVLLVAGLETTVNLISGGIRALALHPEQAALLRSDPSLVPAAIEEMLRHDPPVQFIPRTVLADTELDGRPLRRGDGVLVVTGSANRDPDVFDDPDRFLVTRYAGVTPAARHHTFGLGIHYCLGAPLARMETEIIFRLLLVRTRDLTLPPGEPTYRNQSVIRGLATLPLHLVAA